MNEIEHVKEHFRVNLEETNKLVDEINIENQSLKVKVKGLEEDLVESKAKLEKVSSLKPVIEPKSESTLIKPTDFKVYVPPFKRNHNEEKDHFTRKDKGKRTVNEFHVKKPMSRSCPKHQGKSEFVPTCHHYGVVGHIRPNCL